MKHMATKLAKILGPIAAALSLWAFAAAAQAATLTVTPASQNVNIGDTVTVNINLDTQGQAIDGVDVHYLNYNPYFLQFQGTQVTPGTLMPTTLVNSVDTTNGRIDFSQVTSNGSHYTGSGVLATMTFKALVAGTANLTLDFTQGKTTDCNVASNGNDILSSASNATYTISYPTVQPGGTPVASGGPSTNPSPGSSPTSSLRLINYKGTYYFIINGVRHGITNPGMLYTYGFTFAMGKTATDADMALPEGSLLTPNDGALVKSVQDPTVYLISGQQRYGFVSAKVFTSLGFKFSSVLVVTNPELQALPRATNLADGTAAHLPGLDINRNGTVYWIGNDNQLHGYPSLDVYNSWHLPNDFTRVVPANANDMSMQVGGLITARVLQ